MRSKGGSGDWVTGEDGVIVLEREIGAMDREVAVVNEEGDVTNGNIDMMEFLGRW
jgi:hypothetical protein